MSAAGGSHELRRVDALGTLLRQRPRGRVRHHGFNGTFGVGGGVNYYVAGHAAKVQLNVSQYDDDNDDGMLFQVGVSVGHSHP